MLIIYLTVLIAGLYWVLKSLLPEMTESPSPKKISEVPSEIVVPEDVESKTKKLEILVAEKNRNIMLLQTELKIAQIRVRDFDKIKSLLEEEIHHLKEQNRIFRSELGLPTAQPKENSIT